MAKQTAANDGTRAVSPFQGVKHERSDDEDQEPRLVVKRTDGQTDSPKNGDDGNVASVAECVKAISRTEDTKVLRANMRMLLKCMCTGAYFFDEKQQEFLRLGGPLTIVNVMTKHQDDHIVQQRGIKVLAGATFGNDEAKAVIADADGIQAILKAMSRHPETNEIQKFGLGALRNLSRLAKNAETMVRSLNALPAIINVMNNFWDNIDSVVEAIELLFSISKCENLRKPMVDANVASALVRAIEGHKNNDRIQKSARKAMHKLLM